MPVSCPGLRLADAGLCSVLGRLAAEATLSVVLGWTRVGPRQRAQLPELQINLCLC